MEPDIMRSGGLTDRRTTALLILELCPSVHIDRQSITHLNVKMLDVPRKNGLAVLTLKIETFSLRENIFWYM